MKRNCELVLNAINLVLKEINNYDFNIDLMSHNFNEQEYLKNIIKSIKFEKIIKDIIESFNLTETEFYYTLTSTFNNEKLAEYEFVPEIKEYNKLVGKNNKYAYLLFVSDNLKVNKVFWINIIKKEKNLSSLMSMYNFIPNEILHDKQFKILCCQHALDIGESPYKLPSIYGKDVLSIPSIAINFMESVYYELEYKKELINSVQKIENSDKVYEKNYGKPIRDNIDILMLDQNFINNFININNSFIFFLPEDYITIEMINKKIEHIINQEYLEEKDLQILEMLNEYKNTNKKSSKKKAIN